MFCNRIAFMTYYHHVAYSYMTWQFRQTVIISVQLSIKLYCFWFVPRSLDRSSHYNLDFNSTPFIATVVHYININHTLESVSDGYFHSSLGSVPRPLLTYCLGETIYSCAKSELNQINFTYNAFGCLCDIDSIAICDIKKIRLTNF